MRKLLVLSMIAVLFGAGFSAFSDTVRGGRSIANSMNSSESTTETVSEAEKTAGGAVAARAANRNRAKQVNNTTTARVATRTTAARSAKKTTSAPNTGTVAARAARKVAPAKTSGVVAARAGAKQKAVNLGTKVASANENTMIPQECQDSFYGCMDSFCMLDNVSGGRCRCDDRSEELDEVLEKIMKLDAQSKTLAEQGVERLQHGDAADEIEAMAQDAANKVVAGQKKNQKTLSGLEASGNKSKKTDLSLFTNNMFDTDDLMSEDPFGGNGDFSDKTGTALRNSATKLCGSKLTDQCKEYGSMLQMVYAQKVKSDCVAYENDLKQQKMNSENLLKTAQKAVRDAAAEQYQNKNKYKTVGECVVPFKQCMLGEDVCGAGFSKCVVNKMVVSKTAKKEKAIKTGTTTINIEAATYDAVTSKKEYCSSVLEQCVNVRDKVWNAFLVDIAPELRAAEYSAEDEQRRGCAKNIVTCIKEAASAEGLQEGSDSWAIFTSDTNNVENICKVQLDQCEAYDPNIRSSIFEYVKLSLDAIRADRCTTSIRDCLQKETNCGKDYSQCVGVSNDMMWGMCEETVTVDCKGKGELRSYIVKVAQGLLLSVDSALANACRKIIDSAMTSACGSTDSCSDKIEGVSEQIIADHFVYYICPKGWSNVGQCKTTKEELINEESTKDWEVVLKDKGDVTMNPASSTPFGGPDTRLSNALNTAYRNIANKVLGYDHVRDCIEGREWQGLSGAKTDGSSKRAAPGGLKNITASANGIVIQSLYNAVTAQLQTYKEYLENKKAEDTTSLRDGSLEKKAEEETEEEKTEEEVTACNMGDCGNCGTGEAKCACVALTYFQYGPLIHRDGSNGEYNTVDWDYSGDNCTIKSAYVHGVGKERVKSKGVAYSYADDDDADDVIWASFTIKDDTSISISGCSASTDPGDSGSHRDYMDKLTVGDATVKFMRCSKTVSELPNIAAGAKLPNRGTGACGWCHLDDIHDQSGNSFMYKSGKSSWTIGWKTSSLVTESLAN